MKPLPNNKHTRAQEWHLKTHVCSRALELAGTVPNDRLCAQSGTGVPEQSWDYMGLQWGYMPMSHSGALAPGNWQSAPLGVLWSLKTGTMHVQWNTCT